MRGNQIFKLKKSSVIFMFAVGFYVYLSSSCDLSLFTVLTEAYFIQEILILDP